MPQLFGKRTSGQPTGVNAAPSREETPPTVLLPTDDREEVVKILSVHNKGVTELLFVIINLFGKSVRALFESGATRSFISLKLAEEVEQQNVTFRASRVRVQVANGQVEKCQSELSVPVTIDGYTRSADLVVLTSLNVSCMLGLDMIRTFCFQVDFERLMWRLGLQYPELPNFLPCEVRLNHFEAQEWLEVWADGCCLRNGTPRARAGIGVYFGEDHPYNTAQPLIGKQTNNRAELEAVFEAALRAQKLGAQFLRIYTDSKFVAEFFRDWFPI